MRLLLRSAAKTWLRRPAGPALLLAGVLVATLLVAGGDLALESARQGAEAADRAALGRELGRVWTPGGFTPATEDLETVRADVVDGPRSGLDPTGDHPLFLERDALLTSAGTTTGGWTLLGLERGAFAALGLPEPGDGEVLVDAASRDVPLGDDASVRVQRTPERDVHLRTDRLGQLDLATRNPDGSYTHSEDDEYEFHVDVNPGAKLLALNVTSPSDDTDFDLEAVAPNGTTYLDDAGSPADPDDPALNVTEPEGGNWTVRVHSKAARSVSFRLGIDQVFDARDAQALGRLLEGAGFRAVGAQLGFTEQVLLGGRPVEADLAPLGPAPGGVAVAPLDRVQDALEVEGRASGFLVLASDGDVLEGVDPGTRAGIEDVVADAREAGDASFDPLRGLRFEASADRARAEREAALESTGDLLDVVLPSGVAAGLLLATWASGLHARRLRSEVRVLAALGQDRRRTAALVAAHLAPPLVLGALVALALSPLVAEAVARGAGLPAAGAGLPGATWLVAPGAGAVLVGAVAWSRLRGPARGTGSLRGRAPTRPRRRALEALAVAAVAGVLAGLVVAGDLDPARRVLAGAGAAAAGAAALLWSPLLEPLLGRARSLSVAALGLFRTRSTHRSLALAAAAAALVLASVVSGAALQEAADPDPLQETGGYAVLADAPAYTEDLPRLFPEDGPRADRGRVLLQETLGAEILMRVEGVGLHEGGGPGVDTVYGIDSSFAQRHGHAVELREPDGGDPFRAVVRQPGTAVVSPDVAERLGSEAVAVEGPLGRTTYDVVAVVDTRLVDGVYIAKDDFPVHFRQFAGEIRFRLPADADADAYGRDLQDAARASGLEARSADALAQESLADQRRAGQTLAALGGVGAGAALLLVGLLGLRARSDRRASDAVLLAQGAPSWGVAAGLATEILLPLLVGAVAAVAVVVPLAAGLDALQGLAFPLSPIAPGGVRLRALQITGLLALTGALLAAVLAVGAVRGPVGRRLRELD